MLLHLIACLHETGDAPETGVDGVLTDDNNYTFASALDVPVYATHSGEDVSVCWDEAVHDMQCHAMDPLVDIVTVGLIRLGSATREEVEVALASDSLQQAAVTGYVQYSPDGESCAALSAFSLFGTSIDVSAEYVEGGGTYMVLLSESATPGMGARSLAFLDPLATSDVAEVSVGDGCGIVQVDADLAGASAIRLPAAPSVVNWGELTRDGQGADLDTDRIDSLMLARYEGLSAADLEDRLLDLELIASEMYTIPLAGETEADLALATGDLGAFPGFTGDGTWLFALRCGTCYNPAPLFLGVVEPR